MAFRVAVLALLVSALTVSASFRASAARAGTPVPRLAEGLGVLLLRMAAAIPLLVAVLLFVFRPEALAWSNFRLPAALRWLAVGSGTLAVAGCWWTLSHLGANVSPTVLTREGQQLVTTGPYRWVRHPLYAFGLALLVSIGAIAADRFILAWALAGIPSFRFLVIPAEEARLGERFGEAYAAYRRRTGALLPRPGLARLRD